VVVGGHGDAALRRAARWGDGWAVSAAGDALLAKGFDAVAERLETLRRFCDEEGRSFEDLLLVSQCTTGDSIESLERQAELGIDIVDLMVFGSEEQVIEQGRGFLDRVGGLAT
jgi:alkanesulfonate monooxygenase SsuD/methylene tetrahydromethanopterin reductase-like flavin-dependent oxidoreductase (luciferase family)